RRRHTISKRDWSSDVCSSDLGQGGRDILHGIGYGFQMLFPLLQLLPVGRYIIGTVARSVTENVRMTVEHFFADGRGNIQIGEGRSKERRVGERRRVRRAPSRA